jgi:dolichyl-phosphate beta-glucosyltransferase
MPYDNYLAWKQQPLQEDPVLSVVVPCYNERDRILPTIGAIAAHVCDIGVPWELIIADDGSTDDTVARVEAAGLANLRVEPAPRNLGKGAAVRRGMLAARGHYLLFADADCSTPIQELDKLLVALRDEGADLAIGSRAATGSEALNRSAVRRIATTGLRLLAQKLLRTRVEDTQCGFKLFTRPAARRLFAHQTIDGFSFDLELLFLAHRMGMRIAEVPVRWYDAPGSKVEPLKEARRFLRDVFRIRLNAVRGVYADA